MKSKLIALILTLGVLSPSGVVFAQDTTNDTIELLDQMVPDLVVDAYIVKDFFLGNSFYEAAANANWSKFAANLNGI